MVPVIIETLVVGMPPSPSVVVLRPKDEDTAMPCVLPIWIGPTEAASIGVALEGQARLRPMTHDFLANVIYALNSTVERVVIDRVEGSTFYATVCLQRDGRVINLDARPSDSLALAVRMEAPVFVDEDVLNKASYPYSFAKEADGEKAMEEFRSFIESISPEDFSKVE
ncbi:MAG: bifunctional nuclease family protein [Coriobacteriales bacterium]|jgi:bifunctional DNase/RNase|nr:bifunctional nuclease family protein [Coriobacteriales bacterium]